MNTKLFPMSSCTTGGHKFKVARGKLKQCYSHSHTTLVLMSLVTLFAFASLINASITKANSYLDLCRAALALSPDHTTLKGIQTIADIAQPSSSNSKATHRAHGPGEQSLMQSAKASPSVSI